MPSEGLDAGPAGHSAPNSLRALLADYAALRADRRPFAVASVVGVEGSAFRREGARLLVVPDPVTDFASVTDALHTWAQVPRPQTLGSISGGCLEGEVAWHALDAVRTGRPRTVALTSRLGDGDRAAFGIGCGGTVTVLVQPVRPGHAGPLDAVAHALRSRRTGALALVTGGPEVHLGRHLFARADGDVDGTVQDSALRAALMAEAVGALAAGASRTVAVPSDAGEVVVRIEVVRPPVCVAVAGTGPDARALVRQAALLGWETVAVGASSAPEVAAAIPEADRALAVPEPSDLAGHLDDRTAVVVLTHNFERDRALVGALSAAAVPYLGLLGSRERTARLVADLAEAGVTLTAGRLSSPVGLDIGAETPEEIALATCAEILSHSKTWTSKIRTEADSRLTTNSDRPRASLL
ncbi:XdhC family protein [Rubrivirga sp. S365]|uniref:XdhC family protein n=1 Tax=Rubrivirga litoralis TaxID=3075598 RepID=A0ABU3BTP0_9BACT|nr:MULTISPECIES: XdhC family protein [unclassified Rubrivirga]MDT0632647.1 XdhC family protein [Rubrivirga sp. F394]MDT7857176.1 XdhC family protein [Rubrivirga sp. S365]